MILTSYDNATYLFCLEAVVTLFMFLILLSDVLSIKKNVFTISQGDFSDLNMFNGENSVTCEQVTTIRRK